MKTKGNGSRPRQACASLAHTISKDPMSGWVSGVLEQLHRWDSRSGNADGYVIFYLCNRRSNLELERSVWID